jgi:hypothetical protein
VSPASCVPGPVPADGTEAPVASCATMALGDDPGPKPVLSEQEIADIRRERDALALRIRQSQDTIERSQQLLRRLDQMLAAQGE